MDDLEQVRAKLREDSLLKPKNIKVKKQQEQWLDEAFDIVQSNPSKALELRNKIYKLSSGVPGNVVFLSQEIVERIAQDDIQKAFELLPIIDFEGLQAQTLMKIIHKACDNQSLLDEMILTLCRIGDEQDFKDVINTLSKKVKLTIAEMEAIHSKHNN